MKRLSILGALAVLACAVPALAQGDAKERVRREVDRKQKLMREGKLIRTNVRVTVRLNNGSRLRGVVKQGRMIERHDGLEFVPSDVSSDGAGMRLWYYDGTNSYIFLPFEQIKEHKIGDRLTDEEVKQLGLELERKAREAQARAKLRGQGKGSGKPDDGEPTEPGKAGGPPAAPGGGTDPATGTPPAPASEPSGLTPEQQAILAEFPPEEGWGPTRKRDLELRKIQIDVYPNAQEQKFLDNFRLWIQAYEASIRSTPSAEGSGKPPAPVSRPAPRAEPTPEPLPSAEPVSEPTPDPEPSPPDQPVSGDDPR
jgi:hypothetical protein